MSKSHFRYIVFAVAFGLTVGQLANAKTEAPLENTRLEINGDAHRSFVITAIDRFDKKENEKAELTVNTHGFQEGQGLIIC